jgi:predicted aconitase with swiveling domain
MSELPKKGRIVFYGAGGCGINNVGYFNESKDNPAYADIEVVYIDASHSNLREDFKDESVFILPDVDGSGKIRRENHREITKVIKQVLLQHEPGDFNVVVFSASGGSGSVIGPLIMSELLERGLSAVCMVVGSDESIITANNTLNTLKSLEAIAQRVKAPVVMYYEHNDRQRKRHEIDQQIQLAMSTLAVLANRTNREIDTKDISNWLYFNKTTTMTPQLAILDINTDAEEAIKIKNPISIASIYAHEDIPLLTSIPEYHAAGYLRTAPEGFDQFHFIVSLDELANIYSQVKGTLEHYHDQRNGRVKQDSILDPCDECTDEGLVL